MTIAVKHKIIILLLYMDITIWNETICKLLYKLMATSRGSFKTLCYKIFAVINSHPLEEMLNSCGLS